MSNNQSTGLVFVRQADALGFGFYACHRNRIHEFDIAKVQSGEIIKCTCRKPRPDVSQRNSDLKKDHDMSGTPIWQCWNGAKQRCKNPKHRLYHRYGGRKTEHCPNGITMCKSIQKDFKLFFKLVGPKPPDKDMIDRINNDMGYWCGRADCPDCGPNKHPMNLKWSTDEESANNRGSNRLVTYQKDADSPRETKTLSQWARILKIGKNTLKYRLNQGMTPEEAFTTPVNKRKSHPKEGGQS